MQCYLLQGHKGRPGTSGDVEPGQIREKYFMRQSSTEYAGQQERILDRMAQDDCFVLTPPEPRQ